ncbi:hypothetical protein VNO78_13688 [Psophocarpus tetragonolobus]|uniref:Uncharacterized protein n=1 Tax=Psophocarpus tetragonolobus TaxID=3891 RepID=A0AAN9SPL4_PSOTE
MNSKMRMCKSESALRSLLPDKQIKRQSSGGECTRFDKGSNGVATTKANNIVNDQRKNEKAENVMHLICWGSTCS